MCISTEEKTFEAKSVIKREEEATERERERERERVRVKTKMGGKRSLRRSNSGVTGKDASTSASTSTKRRRKTLDEGNKEILPDDCWEKILESVDDFSVIAFASVCKQLRRVQKRSGRELKKRIPKKLRNCTAAAAGGHLEILKYLHEKGFPWDCRTCRNAALGGHLEVLKYAHENGCPWN